MATVVLIGTLDTKGVEYAFLRDRLIDLGVHVIVVDVGIYEPVGLTPDVTREDVAGAVGANVRELARAGDRGAAVTTMAHGAEAVVMRLRGEGKLDDILALGGSGGASIASQAMRALPIGVPKMIVSTLVAGDTRPYVGAVDLTMMYPIVDIAGLNRISVRILANAAGAIAGMVGSTTKLLDDRPLVGATMFGVTTPCVTHARQRLEELGYEVLVFHATGTGGQSFEALVRSGFFAGVLDVTTTEIADELVGGILSAGPDRLTAAGSVGLPQVVSLGALDMVNFGPSDTIPAKFRGRRLYEHNSTVTLMRTTATECSEIGREIGRRLAAATGPTAVFIPRAGVSSIDVAGQPFHDPGADSALFSGVRETLDGIELYEFDTDVNDPDFATAMAERLHEMIAGHAPATKPPTARHVGDEADVFVQSTGRPAS